MTTLYHGTSAASSEQIKENGFSTTLVFLTPRKDIAEEYGEEIVTVSVDADNLLIDLDLPGAIGITIQEANSFLDNDDWSVVDYINQGYSVCAKPEFITIK